MRAKASPSGRGVQFDKLSVGDDQDGDNNFDKRSDETAPLVTDSDSEEENDDLPAKEQKNSMGEIINYH